MSVRVTEVDGALQVPAQTLSRAVSVTMPEDSVSGQHVELCAASAGTV